MDVICFYFIGQNGILKINLEGMSCVETICEKLVEAVVLDRGHHLVFCCPLYLR